MKLNDIKKSFVNGNVVKAYTRGAFTMEVLMDDGSIKMFKYDSDELMENDIINVNKNSMLILME